MLEPDPQNAEPGDAPANASRGEAVQRLQIGISGLAAMILLVGLANIIQDRAREVDENTVPEAVVTGEQPLAPSQRDPLADAGIVPDLPAEPNQGDDRNASGGANEPQTP